MKEQVFPAWDNLSPEEAGIDVECVDLCEALNLLPEICTIESCSGHGKRPFRIWFNANLENLPLALYYFDVCHCGYSGWQVTVHTDCAMSPVRFLIEGPIGPKAYDQANNIARLIAQYVFEGHWATPEQRAAAKAIVDRIIPWGDYNKLEVIRHDNPT